MLEIPTITNSPAVTVGGNVNQDIDPLLSPNTQSSSRDKDNSLLSELFSLGSGIATNVATAREAQKQRDWQERMQNTAWQRQARDLQKAGLNRILGYAKGSQPSTPSGAALQMKDPMPNAIAARRLYQEIKNLKAQEKKTHADEAYVREQTRKIGVQADIGDIGSKGIDFLINLFKKL